MYSSIHVLSLNETMDRSYEGPADRRIETWAPGGANDLVNLPSTLLGNVKHEARRPRGAKHPRKDCACACTRQWLRSRRQPPAASEAAVGVKNTGQPPANFRVRNGRGLA